MAKFKVGDKVWVLDGKNISTAPWSDPGWVVEMDDSIRKKLTVKHVCEFWYALSDNFCYAENWLITEKSILSKTADRIKRLALSKDDQLLRRYELQDENGSWTSEATEVLMDILLDENKADLVAKAKELEAEDKAAKK